MGKIADAVQAIRQEFAERYGVKAKIWISIHDQPRDLADKITHEMIDEFGSGSTYHDKYQDAAWAKWVDQEPTYEISVSVYYPIEQAEGRK